MASCHAQHVLSVQKGNKMRVKVVYIVPPTPLHRKETSHVLARGEFVIKRRLGNVCLDAFSRLSQEARQKGIISFCDSEGGELIREHWVMRPGRTLAEFVMERCPYNM